MAERPKGNFWFELGIVVLTIALLFSILYPKKIWEKQKEFQNVCRARMEAIQQAEFQYMSLINTYTDTLDTLMRVINEDMGALQALDTSLNWDGIVKKGELERLVMGKNMPADLRELIISKIHNDQPLGRLAKWDSLEYDLLDKLKEQLALSDSSAQLDTLVNWRALLGELGFWKAYEAAQIPLNVKNNIRRDLRRDAVIEETRAWNYLRSFFIDTLKDIIIIAETPDVWEAEQKDEWEKLAKNNWESEMDALSDVEKDSIWLNHQKEFWDRENDAIWKADRKDIWKKTGDEWKENNRATWERLIEREWELSTKKDWEEMHTANQPDSVIEAFKSAKDSLWRAQVDSIRAQNFESWKKKEKKYVEGVIDELWTREKRAEWETSAYQRWLTEKRENFDEFWSELKEGVWNDLRYSLWEIEEKRLAQKLGLLARLDRCVNWRDLVGNDVQAIVDGLNLPDNQMLWQKIDRFDPKKGSALVHYGVAPLFREELLDSILTCPEVHLRYEIDVEDTTVLKRFSVSCPIKEMNFEKYIFGLRAPVVLYYQGTEFKGMGIQFPFVRKVGTKRAYVEKVDPATGEITEMVLKPTLFEKVFGAKSITPHGYIDKDGKKSWVKKG
jgi:hypothetical protein